MSRGDGHWQSEQVYENSECYFDHLIVDIDRAKHSIVLESYIFQLDEVGRQVLAALARAADRQVRIKVLIDGVGSYTDCATIATELNRYGGEVKVFRPLPWRIDLYDLAVVKHKWYAKLIYFFSQINRRDHRKLCIIDEETAWVGSFNIVEHHPSDTNQKRLQDIGVRVQCDAVGHLLDDFHKIWFDKINTGRVGRFKYYLSNAGKRKRQYRNAFMLEKIAKARRRIWLYSAYFSPCDQILEAFLQASKRGVDLRIMTPSESDVAFFTAITKTYYQTLLKSDIKIYEFSAGLLHSKAVLIDDCCYLGSTNMNHRSYYHDLELDVVLRKKASIKELEDVFIRDFGCADSISFETLGRTPLIIRIFGSLLTLLKNWL